MGAGRPLTYDSDTVLDAAMRLFWQTGYEATSLHELLAAMNLSRSSFYHGFGSKHALFVRCLERYQEQTADYLWDRLESASSGHTFIVDTLTWAIEEAFAGADPRGCLVMNTATELAQRDPVIAAEVARGLRTFHSIFAAGVARGQAEGSIREDRHADVLASYLVTTMGGLRTMVKAGTDHSTLTVLVGLAMDGLHTD